MDTRDSSACPFAFCMAITCFFGKEMNVFTVRRMEDALRIRGEFAEKPDEWVLKLR